MNDIKYSNELPERDTYCELFRTTGWYKDHNLSDDSIYKAAENSFHFVSAWSGERLVGVGRMISDGNLHALIVDMIVHPDFQGKRIGTVILGELIDVCRKHNIIDIQLFCADGKKPFYMKNGFVLRPETAPGMQYKN